MIFGRSKGVVGLDIGSATVKLVELKERKGDQFTLQRIGVEILISDTAGTLPVSNPTVAWNADKRYLLELHSMGVPTVPMLVLVPRETPFSAIHLENMLKLARLGVVIVPPNPGFYQQPGSIERGRRRRNPKASRK